MTQPATPLTPAEALLHLRDALGENYEGPTDDETLKRALSVDGQTRPWATAARLIKFNTEYEVGGELRARIDRKIAGLLETQREADTLSGYRPGGVGGFGGISWGDV